MTKLLTPQHRTHDKIPAGGALVQTKTI